MHITDWIAAHKEELLTQLFEFLRFPSVSAQQAHRSDLQATAQWLKSVLESMGFTVKLLEDPPIVYGHYGAAPESPTVMFYGHYDVQPPDPLELWESPPFEPQVRAERVFARGASDDKGQVFIHLAAWRYLLEKYGRLPTSFHVLIEGEEETGSTALARLLAHPDPSWHSDVVVVSDTAFFAEGIPTLTVGLRGLVYTEIRVKGPIRDLHSGSFGGVVENPAMALAQILSALRGPDGRVRIPGFYDAVRGISAVEREAWRQLPADEAHYQRLTGAPMIFGEVGFSPLERIGARPTLDIHGLYSGYIGEGSKTIIPAEAIAKVSMRLVPDQDPQAIWESFRDYVLTIAPPTVQVEVKLLHAPAPAFETPTDSVYYQAAAEAIDRAFGRSPIPIREGGSIPILHALRQAVGGASVILMGFGLPTDAVHSPNEHFRLEQLWKGIEAAGYFYERLGKLTRS